MKGKYNFKKIITIFTVFILLSTLNMIFPVKGKFDIKNNEGLWFDEFTDDENVTLDNCDLDNSNIILNQSEEPLPLDYSSYPDNVDVWYHRLYLLDNSLLKTLSRLITPSLIPGTEADSSEKEKIGQLDGEVLKTESFPIIYGGDEKEYPLQHYKFKVPKRNRESKSITIRWWFGDYKSNAYLDSITMYIWKYDEIIPVWGDNVTVSYNKTNIDDDPVLGNVKADISQTIDVDECINAEGYMDILIVGNPIHNGENGFLNTDYINISVTSKYGYVSRGYATSDLISPNNLGRWDRIVWKGSNPSSKSNITIQILDKNDDLIEGYESKYSPLDISSVEEEEIKIKATLRSSSVDVTPRLDSWAVLFYKKDDYNDSFSNTYRIDNTRGIDISSGYIEISNFYSSWPMFGKNSANTRSYDGKTLSEPEDYYWYSDEDFVGGQFRAPVVRDGKVYVASVVDKTIYAFNEEAAVEEGLQNVVDSSYDSYIVSSSLAVSDTHVIFGTNNVNKDNKIYFLNKSDLKHEMWKYEPDISTCFASSPVVDEGRVFITSWSGYSWDLPIFSKIFSYISGNSKLFAIDPEAEDTLWDPIDIPASSFSTPAIGENKVFVGCQNMYGSNLFSYDVLTGEEKWNISVGSPHGIIGRSSPVYAQGKVFVLCNERKEITDFGTNKLFAINASNGEMLWNKSMGEASIPTIMNYIKNVPSAAPVSTPCFYENSLYVLSPIGKMYALNPSSGKELWSYDFSNESFVPDAYLTSPLVVDDRLYVIIGDTINCLNRENGVKQWDFVVEKPGKAHFEPGPPTITASPVIADGLMFISSTVNVTADFGRVYCYGDYKPNSFGYLESTPIYLPEGKWWNNFSADVKHSTKNNTILFDILDEEENIIDGFQNLNGSGNSLSNVNSNKIRFYAKFYIGNYTESYPILDSWAVDWVDEKGEPFFDWSDTEGWINNDLPDYTVTAEDRSYNSVLSGIDVDSAKYKISYIPTGKTKYTYSGWIDAKCEEPSGVKKTNVTAELSKSGLEIKEIKNITFKISDLAGNTNYSESILLKSDMKDPYSLILNKGSLDGSYFTLDSNNITVSADADDTGGSNLREVILKYRYSNSSDGNWSNWTDYKKSDSYFNWDFGLNQHGGFLKSGFYQIVTVAVDKAGNYEDITDEKIVEFCFDMKLPSIDTNFRDIYESENPVVFSFDISDDFKLDSVLYDFDSDASWDLIESDIEKQNASIRWVIPKEYWLGIREEDEHTVFFKITDICGNEYVTDEDSPVIIKNKNATTRYLDVSCFSDWNWDDTFKITTQNIPQDINIEKVRLLFKYSKDNKTWDEQWNVYGGNKTESPYEWNFTAPENQGYYQFFLEIEDTEGYRYTSSTESVKITVFPLMETVLFIAMLVLLIIVAIYIIRKLKHKNKKL